MVTTLTGASPMIATKGRGNGEGGWDMMAVVRTILIHTIV